MNTNMIGTPNSENTKYLKDLARTVEILDKRGRMTAEERRELLIIHGSSYHTSGKIEEISSIDGSATHCSFCAVMQQAATADKTIVCGACYAAALEAGRETVEARNYLRQLIMSSVKFSVSDLKALPLASNLVRFNSDGDEENTTQAINHFRLCKANPGKRFALWFKNLPAVRAAIQAEGKPRNLTLIYSSCRVNEERADLLERYPWIDYTFTVYADKASTLEAIASGAAECNGRKCKDCGFKCYTRGWKRGNIAEYLRGVNSEKRAELVRLVQGRKARKA